MELFVTKDGRSLRCGYTTGSCAAAAAKAAVWSLLGGQLPPSVSLTTPNGTALSLPVTHGKREADWVSCAVRKSSGDDPDVTDGMLVYARVSRFSAPGLTITIDGGDGVGRVTKPGLDQPVGAAAINTVPRQMIREAAESAARQLGYTGGLAVVISVPEGEALAKKTFNPRLGIIGGLSILGTTGIVDPMSDQAVVDTIRIELRQRAAQGQRCLLLTPGNYGAAFIRRTLGLELDSAVMISNFIGDALEQAAALPFTSVLLVGHIGKLVKTAGNMLNTHSRYGDCRGALFAAHAAACGAGQSLVCALLDCATTDRMVALLEQAGLLQAVMCRLLEQMQRNLSAKAAPLSVEIVTFSGSMGLLGATAGVPPLLDALRRS